MTAEENQAERGVYHVFLLGRNVTLTVAQDSSTRQFRLHQIFTDVSLRAECVKRERKSNRQQAKVNNAADNSLFLLPGRF